MYESGFMKSLGGASGLFSVFVQSLRSHMVQGIICLGALAASSCSSDDPERPASGDAISFSAVAPNGSRAASTTTASLKEFVVYGFTEGSTLLDGVKVTRNGGSWTYSPEAYWPVNPINFYAFSPDITESPDIQGMDGGNIPDYTSPGNVDLLYSVTAVGTGAAQFPPCFGQGQCDAQQHQPAHNRKGKQYIAV